MNVSTRRATRLLPLLVALALLGTACLGEDSGSGTEDSAGGTEADASGGEQTGGAVEVLGAFSGDEAVRFEESIVPFEEETGIEVTYSGIPDFDAVVVSRYEGGTPPDISIYPQPGLLLDLASREQLAPVSSYMDVAAMQETLVPGIADGSALDGEIYGVPMRMAVKSVLWYPVPEFEAAGYTVPETHGDLKALEEQIIADGGTPWCLGIESAAATGWVATDWVEEYMLRTAGPEVYDQWVAHEIPFDDPQVVAAAELFGEIVLSEDAVLGGSQAVLTTPFGEAATPMFDEEPGCWLYRQGNFATGFFPDDVQADLDANVGATYFPSGIEGGFDGNPVLGGGDLAALSTASVDNAAAVQFLEFLGSPEFGGPWATAGGWLSPHTTFDASLFPDEVTRSVFQLAAEADVFRYDASDLMPGAVGTGSFWTEMVNWISGQTPIEGALANIETSWPADSGGAAEATESES